MHTVTKDSNRVPDVFYQRAFVQINRLGTYKDLTGEWVLPQWCGKGICTDNSKVYEMVRKAFVANATSDEKQDMVTQPWKVFSPSENREYLDALNNPSEACFRAEFIQALCYGLYKDFEGDWIFVALATTEEEYILLCRNFFKQAKKHEKQDLYKQLPEIIES